MYKHVNFRRVPKPELEDELVGQFNTLDQKLFAMVEPDRSLPKEQEEQLEITQSELHMLARIIEANMKACGEGDTENSQANFRINFWKERKDLDKLLAKLLAFCDPAK